MKTALLCASLVCMLGTFSGCAFGPSAPFEPSQAFVVNDTTAPLSVEYHSTPTQGLKSGSASTTNVLGLVATGDCGLRTAAKNGGLSTVEFADYRNFNILGIYQKTTVTVYGK